MWGVTFYGVMQSTVTSVPLRIEHPVIQATSCTPDRILATIGHVKLLLIVVRLMVLAVCTFLSATGKIP